jgi:hypothetical protein
MSIKTECISFIEWMGSYKVKLQYIENDTHYWFSEHFDRLYTSNELYNLYLDSL